MKAEPPRAVRIVSQCSSWEEFVAVFQPYLDGGSLFIATGSPESAGSDVVFTMTLASGRTILKGEARVVESHRDRSNFYGLRGMKLRFGELDEASQRTLASLAESKKSPRRRPEPDVIECLIFEDELPVGGVLTAATTPLAPLPNDAAPVAPARATTPDDLDAFEAAATMPPDAFASRISAPDGPALVESGEDATVISRRPVPDSAADTVTERLPALEEVSTGVATPAGTAEVTPLDAAPPTVPVAPTVPMAPLVAPPRPVALAMAPSVTRPLPAVRSRVPRPSDEPLQDEIEAAEAEKAAQTAPTPPVAPPPPAASIAEQPSIPTVVAHVPSLRAAESALAPDDNGATVLMPSLPPSAGDVDDDPVAEPPVAPPPGPEVASELARAKAYKRAGLHPTPIPPNLEPAPPLPSSRAPLSTPPPVRMPRSEATMIVQRPMAPGARLSIIVASIVAALLGLGVGYVLWGLER